MSFTDQKPFTVTKEIFDTFARLKKRFNCKLCGRVFSVGDIARWVYANGKDSPVRCGNFFVCINCDADTTILLQCAKISFEKAVAMAKQWDIYGPEWQNDR